MGAAPYQHRFLDGGPLDLPAGKVVCIGRNYLAHIKELGNAEPETPVLFMKPSTALVDLSVPLSIPQDRGPVHHEVELAVLIGRRLTKARSDEAKGAVAGYAIALDLTLRGLQNELKKRGEPWERSKAFDGSAPISPFLRPAAIDPLGVAISLSVNGELRQSARTTQMMHKVFDLVAEISQSFTLLPGDVVLTGTPAGVGSLKSGDRLELGLEGHAFSATIA